MKLRLLVILMLTALTATAQEFQFESGVDPAFQQMVCDILAEQPQKSRMVPLTILHLKGGRMISTIRSTVRVLNPPVRALSSNISNPPRFYSRIYFGRDGYYRNTPFANSIFVTASGPEGLRYRLFISPDLQVWSKTSEGGSGLFVIRVEPDESPQMFFRFMFM